MEAYSALADTTLISTSSTSTATSTATTAAEELEEDKINFLELLLVQLENQNPLDPMDTTEYTSQLVSYSQLEQLMETNTALSDISSQLSQTALTSNLSYIGQTVEVNSNATVVQDDEVNWTYTVDGTADDVYLTVTNESGETVWEGEGTTASGTNSVNLDLSDSGLSSGTLLYLSVNATDSDGASLDSTVSSFVTVDGVQSDGSTTYLTSGSMSYTLDEVLKIAT